MQIRLLEVKPGLTAVPGSRRRGYLARFSADPVVAWATVVPRPDSEDEIAAGRVLFVEIHHDRIESWAAGEAGRALGLEPLEGPGDFRVHGKIWFVGERMAAIVEAGSFAFDVTTGELPTPKPADGAAVAFTVRGLSLWECEADDAE